VLAFRRGIIGGTTRLDVALLVVFHLAAYVGMTVGYHRMLCHRAFSPHPVVKALLLFFGGTAIMASPSEFVAQHLAHHAHSDTERDPHSASRGFWSAHVGWILARDRVNTWNPAWLARDPMVKLFDRTHALVGTIGLFLPAIVGGALGAWLYEGRVGFSSQHALGGFLWGGLVRLGIGQHLVWASASVNHTFGRRTFPTPDGSRNSPFWLNVLQLGEGFHNHHHALPWSASFAASPRQIDVGALLVRALEALGLARDVRWPSDDDWRRARSRAPRAIADGVATPGAVPDP
jgi:stearoyl-CoA desaturase (delta-9 desaturase)